MINNEHFHFQRFFDGLFSAGVVSTVMALDSKCNEQALTCYEIHLSLSIIDFH